MFAQVVNNVCLILQTYEQSITILFCTLNYLCILIHNFINSKTLHLEFNFIVIFFDQDFTQAQIISVMRTSDLFLA